MTAVCSQCGFQNEIDAKYCGNCGSSLSEILLDIRETLIKAIVTSIGCLTFFIVLMIVVNVAIFAEVDIFKGLIITLIIWSLTSLLILWIVLYLRGGTKERRFVISDEEIVMQIPNRSNFRISWSAFNAIEIFRRTTWNAVSDTQTRYYEFNFKGNSFPESFVIESGRDFSRKAIKKIKFKMAELADKKGFDYNYFKKPPKNYKIIPVP
ncbi:MAG: zinc ribbon domain-containing protein [Candidatus Lokiarchaeota archaeon]|nr:zinc ribbon domain-containing protein [Candidatus Lokiarchaeota archaeon]